MKLIKMLLYGGVDRDDYKRIEGEIWKDNQRRQLLFNAIILLISAGLALAAYRLPQYGVEYWGFFLIDAILAVVIWILLSLFPLKKAFLLPLLDIGYALAYGAAIYIACVLENDRASVSFIVYLVLLPQIANGRPISVILRTFVADICFIFCNLACCSGKVLSTNLMNAVIFGGLIMIMGTFDKKREIQRYLDEYKLRYVGDIDLLTGVNNRNSYEQNLNRYAKICKKELNCIYLDVNGLHALNNSKGHEAGDRMIRDIAGELRDNFRQNDIYRIGGDEFVIFVADTDFATVAERIDSCHGNLAEKDIYVSYGVCNMSKENLEISALVRDAESRMYVAKEAFYTERGLAHR